jgi:hypothetical protein
MNSLPGARGTRQSTSWAQQLESTWTWCVVRLWNFALLATMEGWWGHRYVIDHDDVIKVINIFSTRTILSKKRMRSRKKSTAGHMTSCPPTSRKVSVSHSRSMCTSQVMLYRSFSVCACNRYLCKQNKQVQPYFSPAVHKTFHPEQPTNVPLVQRIRHVYSSLSSFPVLFWSQEGPFSDL